jgi:hypothetical protein
MIASGAGSRALCTSDLKFSRLALQYRGNVMRQINERLQREATNPSLALMMSICGLICTMLETSEFPCCHDYNAVNIHVMGLRTLIRNFGGWGMITTQCFALSRFILWQV